MKHKRFFVVFAFLSLLVFTLPACSGTASDRSTPTPVPTLVKYEPPIFTVKRGSLVSQKSISGEIVPSKQDMLFFRADGMVARLTVKSGDMVKKGDLLAELDVADLLNQLQQANIDMDVAQAALDKAKNDQQYSLQQAQINLAIAKARLDLATIDVKNSYGVARQRALLNQQIADENYKAAQLNVQQISATTSQKEEQTVERQKLTVSRLESLLAERQIVAPYDGVILRVTFPVGKQMTAFAPGIEIGDPVELIIRAQPDTQLEDVMNRDTEVQFSLTSQSTDIHPIHYLPDFVPFSPLSQDQAQLYTQDWMYFSIPTDIPQDQLVLGATVNLNVIIGRAENVLLLPPAAIRNYRGLNFVIVQDGDVRRRVEITKIGLQTNELWEVEGDLQAGDQVVGQ